MFLLVKFDVIQRMEKDQLQCTHSNLIVLSTFDFYAVLTVLGQQQNVIYKFTSLQLFMINVLLALRHVVQVNINFGLQK
jgi:hypothetical protein